MKTKSFARRCLLVLLAVTAGLIVLHLVMQYLNISFEQKNGQIFELSNRLDVDDEVSLPTWYSQFLLSAIAVTALSLAWLDTAKRKLWLLLGIIGAIFAIDEVAAIHELVLQTVHLLFYGEAAATTASSAWWLILPVLIVVGGLLIFWTIKLLPAKTWPVLAIGGVIFCMGAAGSELISNDFAKTTFMYQGVITAIEEGLEMLGSILILYGMLDYLETHFGTMIRRSFASLKNQRDGA